MGTVVEVRDQESLEKLTTWYENRVLAATEQVLRRTARQLDPHDPVHSANLVRTLWRSKVDGLVADLGRVYGEAQAGVREQLQQLANAVVAAVDVDPGAYEIPPPQDVLAEIYLQSRANFVANLGTDVWTDVKSELLDGMQLGESITELRNRVQAVAQLSAWRAERIARTEVVGASNAGAYAQMQASGLEATKTWLATNDKRTRPSHREANGQTVAMSERFEVGDALMERPHDPAAPVEEIVQCRCTLTFEVPEDALTAALEQFYRASQPRDHRGRWTRHGTISGGDAHAHADAKTNELQGKERAALISYGGAGYRAINDGLRKKGGDPSKVAKKARDEISHLDNAFKNAKPLDKPIGVHRGMNNAAQILGTTDPSKLKGKVITDHGFMSTTTDESITRRFGYTGTPATFNITVPEGKKVINVDKALGDKNSPEPEILLPRGTSLRIVGVKKTGNAILDNERLIIDAEVV